MKTIRIFVVVVLACLCLAGCVTITKFTYSVKSPIEGATKVQSKLAILFTINDLRPDPEVIGIYYSQYGIKGKTIKSSEMNISNSFFSQFKDVLVKNGFSITEDDKKYDLSLNFSIRRFTGEFRDGLFKRPVTGSCCIRLSLKSGADGKVVYLTDVCGASDKNGDAFAWKKSTLEGLSEATDNALNKILNETELVNKINSYKK